MVRNCYKKITFINTNDRACVYASFKYAWYYISRW